MTRKDFFYIGLILIGLVGHFVIVGQAEHPINTMCSGFYVIRSNPKMKHFYDRLFLIFLI